MGYTHKDPDLTTTVKRLRSGSKGEIQLKLFDSEIVQNPVLLEKHPVAEMEGRHHRLVKNKNKQKKLSIHIASYSR